MGWAHVMCVAVTSLCICGWLVAGIPYIVTGTSSEHDAFVIKHNDESGIEYFKSVIIAYSNMDVTDVNRFECDLYNFTFALPDDTHPHIVRLTVFLPENLLGDDICTSQTATGALLGCNTGNVTWNGTANTTSGKALNTSVTIRKGPTCTINWGDSSATERRIQIIGQTIDHEYQNFGFYSVTITCTDGLSVSPMVCPEISDLCVKPPGLFPEKFKDPMSPMRFLVTENIVISTMDSFASSCQNLTSSMTWALTNMTANASVPVGINHTGESDLQIMAGILDVGIYVVKLTTTFDVFSPSTFIDYILLRLVLPNLLTYISQGGSISVAHGTTTTIDASLSFDPAGDIPSVAKHPLYASWSVISPGSAWNVSAWSLIVSSPPNTSFIPQPGIVYTIENGTEFLLRLNTSLLPNDTSRAYAMFSLERGLRQSSSIIMLEIKPYEVISTEISCVYNCLFNRERRINHDNLELVVNTPHSSSALDFYWSVHIWNGTHLYQQQDNKSDYNSRFFLVPKESLKRSSSYLFQVRISPKSETSFYGNTSSAYIAHVGVLPYSGNCTIEGKTNKEYIEVLATESLLQYRCQGWKGPDYRLFKNPKLDVSPILNYNILQITNGVLKNETISNSRNDLGTFILKVGDPNEDYNMRLIIRILDIHNDFTEIIFTIRVLPAFEWYHVTPTAEGAAIISNYYEEHYLPAAERFRMLGKYDLRISHISSVASHLHLINLPVFELPLPPVLNSEGSILGLQTNGGKDKSDSLEEVIQDIAYEPDPATLAIQQLVGHMVYSQAEITKAVIENFSNNTLLLSLLTNANTNLMARENFISIDGEVGVIGFAKSSGSALMKSQQSATDNTRSLYESSREVYTVTERCVKSAVSKELKQYRHIDNFLLGLRQVSEMLDIVGQNISLDESDISPDERAFVYLLMQKRILLDIEINKKVAVKASDMMKTLLKTVRDSLPLCNTCSNRHKQDAETIVVKNKVENIQQEWLSTSDGATTFNLNGSLAAKLGNDSGDLNTAITASEMKENVFMYDDDLTSSFVSSTVLELYVKVGKSDIAPESMTYTQTVTSAVTTLTTPTIDPDDASELSLHIFFYQSKTDYVCLRIKPVFKRKELRVLRYTVYFNFRKAPTALDYAFVETVSWKTDWLLYIEPAKMAGHTGLTHIGVSVPGLVKQVKYEFSLVTVACVAWEEKIRKWHPDKCVPEWLPVENKVICTCENLTDLVFGNTFNPAPNTIDFSTVFLKFSPQDQAAILGVMGGLFLIYFILLVLLCRLDRKDRLKWGMTPLRDNHVGDEKFYILTVSTGLRKGSGTRSRIGFKLTGTGGITAERELFDGVRQEFSSGSDMVFLMSTRHDLGFIEHMYIWHDNSGGSWYLNRIKIYDPDKSVTYTFVGEQWLSLDTSLDASLYSNLQTKTTLPMGHIFCLQTRIGLSDRNMWTSILYRPQSSVFTRVQRVSCLFLYIMLTMFTSAMFYRDDSDYESVSELKVGPFRFTIEQIYRSVMSALISTPPIMLISFLFKRTRPEQFDIAHRRCNSCCCSSKYYRNRYEDELRKRIVWCDTPDVQGGVYLPHWFLCIVWFLTSFGIKLSAFFTVLYCIEWGKQKSEEWLMSICFSLVESVLVVDPIMMMAAAFVISCLFRKKDDVIHYDMEGILTNYRQMFQAEDFKEYSGFSFHVLKNLVDSLKPLTRFAQHVPVTGREFKRQLKHYKHKREVTMVLKNLALNMALVFIIVSICYSARDDTSYHHQRDISSKLVSPALKRDSPLFNFASIKKHEDLYKWLNITVFPWLFPEKDILGDPLHWTVRMFTSGHTYLRLGPPRLRQLRTKQDRCHIPYIGSMPCYRRYNMFEEDDGAYCLGWTSPPCSLESRVKNISLDAWSFTSGFDIWGLPLTGHIAVYGGGGYISTFNVNRNMSVSILNEMKRALWLDRQTRSVVLEFTLFCADTNLFIFNEFLIEFPETGGALTSHKIYPLRLYNNIGLLGQYVLVCEVILVLYLIFMICRVVTLVSLEGKMYFKNIWKIYDILIISLISLTICFFVVRFLLARQTIKRFKENKNIFVNFGHVVFWDNLLATSLGFLAFFVCIYSLQFLNKTKKIKAIAELFAKCGYDLLWFGLTFWYMFMGFVLLGCLLFGSRIPQFLNVFIGMKTLFLALIGKSIFKAITEVHPILAQVFFIIYSVCIIFFVMVIFLSILGDGLSRVLNDQKVDEKTDIIDYFINMVTSFLGRRQRNRHSPEVPRMKYKPPQQMSVSSSTNLVPHHSRREHSARTRRIRWKTIHMSQRNCPE